MNTRIAPSPPVADAAITADEWQAMSAGERAFIQAGADAIDRGEFLTDDAMQLEFDRILAAIPAK